MKHSSVVVVLAALATLGVLIAPLLPAFVGILIDYKSISEEAAGGIAARNIFGLVAGVWASMFLVRKLDPKIITIGGLLGILSFDVLTVLLPIEYLGAIRILAGISGGLVLGIGVSSLAQLHDSDRGFAIFTFFQFFVGAVVFVSLPFVLPATNGSAYSLLVAGMALIALAVVFRTPVFQAVSAEHTRVGPTRYKFESWLTVLSFGVFQCGAFSIWTFMDRIGLEADLSMEVVGATLAGGSLAGAFGAALAAYLGVRNGRLVLLAGGAGVFVIGILLLIIGESWAFVVGNFMIGLGWAFALPFFFGVMAVLDPDGDLAMAGVSVALIGMALGPALAVFFLQGNGFHGSLLAGVIAIIIGVLMVIPGTRQAE